MFLSALIDVAGHAGKIDAAFEVLNKARMMECNLESSHIAHSWELVVMYVNMN